MALIKCEECGKEISDKASHCVNCGCPVIKKVYCLECGYEINESDKICKKCGCPVNFDDTKDNDEVKKQEKDNNINDNSNEKDDYYDEEFVIAKMEINTRVVGKYEKFFRFMGILFIFMIVTIPYGVYMLLYYHYIKGCRDNNVVLTNKRIKGTFRTFFATNTLDITLDKIDSVNLNSNIFKINQFDIISGARANVVLFVSNGEEFRSKTVEEMEKYKMYMYGNRNR